MQIDELRGELTSLADEIPPFAGDVGALHRRERRHRIVVSSFAVVVVVVVGMSTVAIVRHDGNDRVRVAAGPDKEVSPDQVTHIDAIVVPATPAVKAALEKSPLVAKYVRLPKRDRASDSLFRAPNAGVCALQTDDGYAVVATTPGTNFRAGLAAALSGNATVYDVSDQFGTDLEIFLRVGTSPAEIAAVEATLTASPDIASFRYVSPVDAYAIFKKDFADQPALVESTKPSDLPASFRVNVAPGRSVDEVVRRYRARPSVDTTITPALGYLFDPAVLPLGHSTAVSPCAKP